MIKYYIGRMTNVFGERELDTVIRFKTTGDPYDYFDRITAQFWGEEDGVDEGEAADATHYFAGGEISAYVDSYKKVSRQTYENLEGIITELDDRTDY